MPRSGGDYVYISRTLHPYLGFLSSWNWMVWLVTYTGIPAAYLAQYGLSGLCREAGYASTPAAVAYGDNFTRKWWIFAAGTILLTVFAIIFALGTRLYFRIQTVTFMIAMTGVVIGLSSSRSRATPIGRRHERLRQRPRRTRTTRSPRRPSHQGT